MSKFSQALKKIQTVLNPDEAAEQAALESRLPQPFEPHKSIERRRAGRTPCLVQARAIISFSNQDSWITHGRVVNISPQGLLFELHDPVVENDPLLRKGIDIHVSLIMNPETKETLDLEGQIIRNLNKKKVFLGVSAREKSPECFAAAHSTLLRQTA